MDTIIPEIAEAMWHVLGEVATYAGRVSGFIKRKRKLTGASFVQTLVFGYLAEPNATTAEIRQAAATLDIDITRQGLDQRFGQASARCLELVLQAAVEQVFQAAPVGVDLLKRFTAVHLVDSSTIVLPDSLGEVWAGCGGSSATNTQAAVKISVNLDLLTGRLDGPLLQAGRTPDRQALAQHEALEAGSVLIADLAYFSLTDFAAMTAAKRYFLSHLKARTKLFTSTGEALDIVAWLAAATCAEIDCDIQLGQAQHLACRLIAVRVPPEVAAERRQRLEAEAREKGQAVSQERLDLVHWTIFVTNVPRH